MKASSLFDVLPNLAVLKKYRLSQLASGLPETDVFDMGFNDSDWTVGLQVSGLTRTSDVIAESVPRNYAGRLSNSKSHFEW